MKIDKYEIKKFIGEGQFGIVYAGINIITNKKVAIKKCNKHLSNFKNEIKICNHLRNIKGVYRLHWFGTIDNYKYLVIDRLGPSLSHYLAIHKQFDQYSINYIAIKLITILEAIHLKGIIHRDIKLDNILVDYETKEEIYLIDFGLAKSIYNKSNTHIKQETNKSIVGTPNYISLWIHKGSNASRRDDIISIAYILEEIFTGYLEWYNENNKMVIKKETFKSKNNIINLFLNDVMTLNFYDKPNYSLLKSYFTNEIYIHNTLTWRKTKYNNKLLNEY